MTTITRDELLQQGRDLYGSNRLDWKFKCSGCGNIQSGKSIIKQMEEGIKSQRYGLLLKGDHQLQPESSCYSPDCNWVAGGLFRSPVLMIYDPTKPYDINLYENCASIFEFANELQDSRQEATEQ